MEELDISGSPPILHVRHELNPLFDRHEKHLYDEGTVEGGPDALSRRKTYSRPDPLGGRACVRRSRPGEASKSLGADAESLCGVKSSRPLTQTPWLQGVEDPDDTCAALRLLQCR